jgi:hypothetical protein
MTARPTACHTSDSSSSPEPSQTMINYLCTYDLYFPVRNVFDANRYLRRQVGGGSGPGNGVFWAL